MELRIKELMEAQGVTNVAMAKAIGLSKVAISNIVTGKSFPSLPVAVAMAEVLGVGIQDLVVGSEAPASTTEESKAGFVCPHCGKPLQIHLE